MGEELKVLYGVLRLSRMRQVARWKSRRGQHLLPQRADIRRFGKSQRVLRLTLNLVGAAINRARQVNPGLDAVLRDLRLTIPQESIAADGLPQGDQCMECQQAPSLSAFYFGLPDNVRFWLLADIPEHEF